MSQAGMQVAGGHNSLLLGLPALVWVELLSHHLDPADKRQLFRVSKAVAAVMLPQVPMVTVVLGELPADIDSKEQQQVLEGLLANAVAVHVSVRGTGKRSFPVGLCPRITQLTLAQPPDCSPDQLCDIPWEQLSQLTRLQLGSSHSEQGAYSMQHTTALCEAAAASKLPQLRDLAWHHLMHLNAECGRAWQSVAATLGQQLTSLSITVSCSGYRPVQLIGSFPALQQLRYEAHPPSHRPWHTTLRAGEVQLLLSHPSLSRVELCVCGMAAVADFSSHACKWQQLVLHDPSTSMLLHLPIAAVPYVVLVGQETLWKGLSQLNIAQAAALSQQLQQVQRLELRPDPNEWQPHVPGVHVGLQPLTIHPECLQAEGHAAHTLHSWLLAQLHGMVQLCMYPLPSQVHVLGALHPQVHTMALQLGIIGTRQEAEGVMVPAVTYTKALQHAREVWLVLRDWDGFMGCTGGQLRDKYATLLCGVAQALQPSVTRLRLILLRGGQAPSTQRTRADQAAAAALATRLSACITRPIVFGYSREYGQHWDFKLAPQRGV